MDLSNLLDSLDRINPESASFTAEDLNDAEQDNKDLNKDIQEAELDRYKINTRLRDSLAKVFTIIIAMWLLSVVLILTGNFSYYHLSDSVLITLITTTTVNVLGMMLIILYDLFPGGKNNK